jgi:hypothetical protein
LVLCAAFGRRDFAAEQTPAIQYAEPVALSLKPRRPSSGYLGSAFPALADNLVSFQAFRHA